MVPTKPCATQYDLSLAYSPGVAEPVREIARDPEMAYRYTNKGNLVAVISNGTAILGLGNRGALAAKPVLEGKGVLFKHFAGIDVFDIEVNAPTMEAFIETVAAIAPTFGGINLEDIAAPECFMIEEALEARLDIPVFHDDQHGTAVIVGAGLVKRAGTSREKNFRRPHRLSRRRRRRHHLHALAGRARRHQGTHHPGRQQGRDPRRARRP